MPNLQTQQQSLQINIFILKILMKTLKVTEFPTINPYNSRGYSITTLQKRSYKQNPPEKYQKYNSLSQQTQTNESLSKKFLYFHESPKKIETNLKNKISFPYNALNLCYFDKKFSDIKDKQFKKSQNFHSNNQIINFLNTKLKTEPASKQQIGLEKQLFIGKKHDEKRIHNDQNLKQKIMFSIEKYQMVRNSPQKVKNSQFKRFPGVLKIKSKKAYFQSRYKNMKSKYEDKSEILQKERENQVEYNPFEFNYRSKTEDNISVINSIRDQIRASIQIKAKHRIEICKKQEKYDPWQADSARQQTSFKLYQNYY